MRRDTLIVLEGTNLVQWPGRVLKGLMLRYAGHIIADRFQ